MLLTFAWYIYFFNSCPCSIDMQTAVDGIFLSEDFKTNHIFGFQPVTFPLVMELYLQYVRPDTDCPYLFVTNSGQQVAQGYINKCFNTYYLLFGLDMNVTTVRKMIHVSLKQYI
jgi:hypothetical protein